MYFSNLNQSIKPRCSFGGLQLYEKIVQLKFESNDEKKYATDCLETKEILRLFQSFPSPKASN